MQNLDKTILASISGGMRWEQFRPSENVEDRRGWTREQHRRAPVGRPIPMPQSGPFDQSIDDFVRRNRRR